MYTAKSSGLGSVARAILIASGKGGVGKSSITANLARVVQARGVRVGVLDADLYGPSMSRLLPAEVTVRQEDGTIAPGQAAGIPVVSMAHFRQRYQAAAVRAPIAGKTVEQFLHSTLWGERDFLLLDCPSGTGDILLNLGQQAALAGALLVTTPQALAVDDVRRVVDLFRQLRVKVLGVVETMSYLDTSAGDQLHPFGSEGGTKLAAEGGFLLLAQIPLDPKVAELRPTATVMEALGRVADRLLVDCTTTAPRVERKNPHHFILMWHNGRRSEHRMSELQTNCPCARCSDPIRGTRRLDASPVDPNVRALRILPVGEYALRIDFTLGCSSGIYTYERLYAQ